MDPLKDQLPLSALIKKMVSLHHLQPSSYGMLIRPRLGKRRFRDWTAGVTSKTTR